MTVNKTKAKRESSVSGKDLQVGSGCGGYLFSSLCLVLFPTFSVIVAIYGHRVNRAPGEQGQVLGSLRRLPEGTPRSRGSHQAGRAVQVKGAACPEPTGVDCGWGWG